MNLKEIKELVEFLIEKDIAEFELERGDVKVRIRRGNDGASADTRFIPVAAAPAAAVSYQAAPPPALQAAASPSAAQAPPAAAPKEAVEEGLHEIKSPIVGTFYEAPSPGAPPFVKAGDEVTVGQVLCIIEAMKLMNEIEADVAGEIVKRLVANGQPVEYGQGLFLVRPK
jgi:acetyl-CoA carboxylase biotin carboxyl carrier protein